MGIPHAAWVTELTAAGNGVNARQQLQDVIETVHMPFPCLVTVEQDIFMPRLPSLKIAREIKDKEIHIQGLDSFLDTDESHYGLSGSPTQVERIFPPDNDTAHEMWEGEGLADKLHDQLKKWKFV
jgi:electron transfer flavoprotein beta subunit